MGRVASGVGRICGVVAASTALEMVAGIKMARRETSTLELRLDWLASNAERSKLLAWVRNHHPQGCLLYTSRCV